MSERPEPGVFLERRSYRRRRLLDGLKLLPLVAAWLFVIPMFWPAHGVHDGEPKSMSSALVYIFGAWIVLIILSAGLVAGLNRLSLKQDASENAPKP